MSLLKNELLRINIMLKTITGYQEWQKHKGSTRLIQI